VISANRLRDSYDVIVAGGGVSGVAATLAAARLGASVLVVERYGFLGGMATAGLVGPFMTDHFGDQRVVGGVFQEIVDRLVTLDGSTGPMRCPYPGGGTYGTGGTITVFDPILLRWLLQEMVLEAGADVLYHSAVLDVLKSEDRVTGIVACNRSGQRVFSAKAVVDCTGDGDVLALAGAKWESGRASDGLTQPATLFFRMGGIDGATLRQYMREHAGDFGWTTFPVAARTLPTWMEQEPFAGSGFYSFIRQGRESGELRLGRERITFFSELRRGEVRLNATRVSGIDATRAEDMTNAEVEGMRQVESLQAFLRKCVPGFADAYVIAVATQVGVRESRRVMGEYVLTADDVLHGRVFDDAIACASYPIDIHQPDGAGNSWRELQAPYTIPYRCLLPQGLRGLLVAGRAISATSEAMASARVMPTATAVGEAAGTGAAMAARRGPDLRDIDVRELQEQLRRQGACVTPA
jgi:glycine/D-amino acid oxidase-like deaminating enzyme